MTQVLITGVHTGLGHALARRCLERGDVVYGLSRRPPDDLIEHERMHFAALDLTRFSEIERTVDELLRDERELDLVLLNAGVLGQIKDLADTSYDELRAVMDINVWANKELIDALMASERAVGHVVAISSGAAVAGSGGWGSYSISKAALNLLVRVYSNEQPGTHFTALAPGVVETDMIRTILAQPHNPRYGATARVRAAGDEGRIQTPDAAALRVLGSISDLRGRYESGAFVDVRKM